jgi:endonuclease/exonuclease/phosphatase family metal-dependent hydrolase
MRSASAQWARENGCHWSTDVCSSAARGGHLSILKWLRKNECDWDKREEDLLELKNVVKKLVEAKNALVLFMGDFNAEANEKWYEAYQKDGIVDIFYGMIRKKNAKRSAARKKNNYDIVLMTLLAFHNKHAQATFNGGPERRKHIDFLLAYNAPQDFIKNISNCYLGNALEQHPLTTSDESWPTQNIPSDHLPLTVVANI